MSIYEKFEEMSVGAIVTADFRAAAIFRDAGIDFCCGGDKSLAYACEEKNKEPDVILNRLRDLEKTAGIGVVNYNDWDLGFLADYIQNTHHKFVFNTLPEMVFNTRKILNKHVMNHPELAEISILTEKINTELMQHLRNEEDVLFPAIKTALQTKSLVARETIASEISRMKIEHEFAGAAMDEINRLTSGYRVPPDACVTYKLTYDLLNRFEDDLHVHVHLENNILYPKAISL